MISLSHSPNSDRKQQLSCLKAFLPPFLFRWKQPASRKELEAAFTDILKTPDAQAYVFSTGREALYAALKACGINQGDEVLIQAYTCIVVPNSILWAGGKPVYVDIDETGNIDASCLKEKMTEKTKAVIIQHTFGVPADIEEIRTFCKQHKLALIEDCAHALGAKYGSKPVGTFGDIAIFSFGRDKIISSVSGGMVLVNNQSMAERVEKEQNEAPERPAGWIAQNLLHPILVPWMARLMGRLKIGQMLLRSAQSLKLLNKVYRKNEYQSVSPAVSAYKMPGILCTLALDQLKQLEELNGIRRQHAAAYRSFCKRNNLLYQQAREGTEPAYLRFTVLTEKRDLLLKGVRERGYLLGNWYNEVIVPKPSDWQSVYYREGECPKAEEWAKRSLNLPTHRKMTSKMRKEILDKIEKSL